VYPRPVQDPLPVWIAVGGTPQSAVRAGTLGLPLAVAIIGGEPERFGGFVELYREAGRRAGHDASRLRVSINSHGYVADDSRRAADEWYPSHAEVMSRIGRERGWPPETRAHFEQSRGPRGALLVGDPQEVTDKILFEHGIFRMDRFMLQISVGPVPHRQVMRSIELYGTVVAPAVRKAVSP
jgi:alkanesulfonate monooxygenase SsuD/methylene tetrahydromethanopterin reductase-like flavin-dependent oxidoreductase (luciferase family)